MAIFISFQPHFLHLRTRLVFRVLVC